MTYKNSLLRRARTGCFFLLGFFVVLLFPKHAYALTAISYGPSGSVVGTFVAASQSNFTLFTPANALNSGNTITLTFPSGTTLNSSNIATSDFLISQAAQGLCINAGSDTAPTNVSVNTGNRTITLTIAAASTSKTAILVNCGLGVVTIKTSGTAGGNEIQHPTTVTTSGTYQVDTNASADTGSISNVTFVFAAAAQVAFTTQPSGTVVAGTNLATQPVVTIQDQYGNTITNSSAQVTLAAVLASDGTTAGGGTLAATTNPLTASSGVATFAGVNYTKAESIKLKATSSGLTQALSNTIVVSPASATKLAVSQQPSSTGTAGTNLSTQPIFLIQDTYSNTVTGDNTTQVIIAAVLSSDDTTAGGGTLNATSNPVAASSGIVTFAGVNYTKAESIKLKATASGLTQVLTITITISPASATKIGVSQQPSSTGTAGTALTVQPVFLIQDTYSNTVTSDNSTQVTLAAVLASDGTTAGGGTLSATTNPVTTSSGVVTFAGVSYTKAEAIKLKATASGLTQVLTNSVTISHNSATKLAVSQQPSSTGTAGTNLGTQPIFLIQDAYDNTVTSDSSTQVTLWAVLASDTNTPGNGTLSATTNPRTTSSGIVSFTGVNYTKAEAIKLKATASGLTQVFTQTITVSAGSPTSVSKVSGDAQSASVLAALTTPFTVLVTDTYSNTVQGATVTFSVSSSPSSAIGYSFTSSTPTTNSSGNASTTFTVGNEPGTYSVQVAVTGATNIFFSATAISSPTHTNTSPNSGGQRATHRTITLQGTGFMENPTISISGTGITIDTVSRTSATQLVISISITETASTGTRNITITNTDGGTTTTSNALTITSAPTIQSTSVTRMDINQGPQEMVLTGTNFSGASVDIGGETSTSNTQTNSSTQITTNLSILSNATRGWRQFTVTNADGGISAPYGFLVAPALSVQTPTVSITGEHTALLTWSTNTPTTSVIRYGTTANFEKSQEISTAQTDYSITLGELASSWVYRAKIIATDAYGQTQESDTILFTAGVVIENDEDASTPTSSQDESNEQEDIESSDVVSTPLPQPTESERVSLTVFVVDAQQVPIRNATVELHSTPRITTTDERGYATFPDVEKGDHTIYLAYDVFKGEKKVKVLGSNTDEQGKPYDTIVVEVVPTLTAAGSWKWLAYTIICGLVGGLLGALALVCIVKRFANTPAQRSHQPSQQPKVENDTSEIRKISFAPHHHQTHKKK